MAVEAGKAYVKHLALDAEPVAAANGAGDRLQLYRQWVDGVLAGIGVDVGQRVRHPGETASQHGAAEGGLGTDRAGSDRRVFFLERVAVVRSDYLAQGVGGGRHAKHGVVQVIDWNGSRATQLVLLYRTAAEKQRIAGVGDAGEGGVAVCAGHHVAQPAAPARAAGEFR